MAIKVNWKLILDPLVVSDSGNADARNLDWTGITGAARRLVQGLIPSFVGLQVD